MIFIIEGLPGSGKTTFINRIKEMELLNNIVTMPEILPELEGDPNDFGYYVFNDLEKSRILCSEDFEICLCDRCWISTIVYTCAMENIVDITQFIEMYKKIYGKELFSDYYYVYLNVNIATSIKKANLHDVKSNWQDIGFVNRAQKLYNLVYEKIEYINPKILGKTYIDIDKLGWEVGYEKIVELISKFSKEEV